MNQILDKIKNRKKIINILKIQIFFSILGILAVIFFLNSQTSGATKAEIYSKELLINQKLINMYATTKTEENSNIFGTIEIEKIRIVYPVFNSFSAELLKLGPCKFNGPNINETGNISIAGHNLENHSFFSDLNQLEINDTIFLYSNSGEKFEYIIYKTYETNSDDLSPLSAEFINKKELTLITCNNKNKKRFIVKALFNEY